jgi:hypothetical protein
VLEPAHNHNAFEEATADPSLRRLSDEHKQRIASLSALDLSGSQVTADLRTPDAHGSVEPIVEKDISNVRQHLRLESLAGHTSIQALPNAFDGDNFIRE